MPKLKIKNIGAIKDATIDAKRFTLIIGSQSSGKSTIAKLLSFCAWLEKQALIEDDFKKFDTEWLDKHLFGYHQLKSYFDDESSFTYEGKAVHMSYHHGKEPIFQWQATKDKVKPLSISYIPSERNFTAVLHVGMLNKLDDSYINGFIHEWLFTRTKYTRDNAIPLLNLGHSYYFNEASEEDKIYLAQLDKTLSLREVSSGLQSLTPLHVMIHHMTQTPSKELLDISYSNLRKQIKKIKQSAESDNIAKILLQTHPMLRPQLAHLIIEEPEQNLFPNAQRDLVEYIVKSAGEKHQVLMTTHSPYILLAVNNMILRSLVKDDIHESERTALLKEKETLSAEETALYQITKDGKLEAIQDEDGLLEENFLNEIYSNQGDEFAALLNYYSYND